MAPKKFLVFHTAFIGDVVLALPVAQLLRQAGPRAHIAFVAVPAAAAILENNPAVNEVIRYDKRAKDAGLAGVFRLAGLLRGKGFDVAVVPHRSLRSAVVVWLARIPRRIGFSTSAARWLFTDIVPYEKDSHEIDRNLSLLKPLGLAGTGRELPALYPSTDDVRVVDRLLFLRETNNPLFRRGNLLGLAPGSVWNTKRWPRQHFIDLGKLLAADGFALVLLGSVEDRELCEKIERMIGSNNVLNASGNLSLLQSADLIRRCSVLVSNDSAPMHLGVGMGTPVVSLFGATVPRFGFAPRGKHDVVAEIQGLPCRPCSIHGGEACPIGTFVCMNDLKPEIVYAKVKETMATIRTVAR